MKTRELMCKSVFLSGVLVMFLGCHSSDALLPTSVNPPLGVQCAVEMRPPLPSGYSAMRFTGTLKAANDKWIVIHNDKKPEEGDMWLPREAVFAIITGKSAAQFKGFGLDQVKR